MDHDRDGPLRDTHRHGGAYIGNEGHRPGDKSFQASSGSFVGNAGAAAVITALWYNPIGRVLLKLTILIAIAYAVYETITAEPYESKEWREIECAHEPSKTCRERILPN